MRAVALPDDAALAAQARAAFERALRLDGGSAFALCSYAVFLAQAADFPEPASGGHSGLPDGAAGAAADRRKARALMVRAAAADSSTQCVQAAYAFVMGKQGEEGEEGAA